MMRPQVRSFAPALLLGRNEEGWGRLYQIRWQKSWEDHSVVAGKVKFGRGGRFTAEVLMGGSPIPPSEVQRISEESRILWGSST